MAAIATLNAGQRTLRYVPVADVPGVDRLPFSLRVLLENLLRHEDGHAVTTGDIEALAH